MSTLQATQPFKCLYMQLVGYYFDETLRSERSDFLVSNNSWQKAQTINRESVSAPLVTCSSLLRMGSIETELTYSLWEESVWHIFIHHILQHRFYFWFPDTLPEVCVSVATCLYLRVLEKSRDASDVQAEASRGASCSVNTGSEERVVLLPRRHTSRAR